MELASSLLLLLLHKHQLCPRGNNGDNGASEGMREHERERARERERESNLSLASWWHQKEILIK